MDYRIQLDPKLGLNSFRFIVAWNQTPECRAVAEARMAKSAGAIFDPRRLTGTSMMLERVRPEVTSATISDLLQRILAERGIAGGAITETTQPDGTRVLAVAAAGT